MKKNEIYLSNIWQDSIWDSIFNFPRLVDSGIQGPFEKISKIGSTNIQESDSYYQIEIQTPGFTKEKIQIGIENGILTVEGKNHTEEQDSQKNYTRQEFQAESFSRSFKLPENIKEYEISAKCENGILKIQIPKDEILQQKKTISIE